MNPAHYSCTVTPPTTQASTPLFATITLPSWCKKTSRRVRNKKRGRRLDSPHGAHMPWRLCGQKGILFCLWDSNKPDSPIRSMETFLLGHVAATLTARRQCVNTTNFASALMYKVFVHNVLIYWRTHYNKPKHSDVQCGMRWWIVNDHHHHHYNGASLLIKPMLTLDNGDENLVRELNQTKIHTYTQHQRIWSHHLYSIMSCFVQNCPIKKHFSLHPHHSLPWFPIFYLPSPFTLPTSSIFTWGMTKK